MFVDQETLLAVNYAAFETEQELLEATLYYLYDHLLPKLIHLLEDWRKSQEGGTKKL